MMCMHGPCGCGLGTKAVLLPARRSRTSTARRIHMHMHMHMHMHIHTRRSGTSTARRHALPYLNSTYLTLLYCSVLTDLARQRHAAMPASAVAADDANPFNPTSAMVWSSAAPWTQDGAAAQVSQSVSQSVSKSGRVPLQVVWGQTGLCGGRPGRVRSGPRNAWHAGLPPPS